MIWSIFTVGLLFVLVMFGFIQYFKHAEVDYLFEDFSWQTYIQSVLNFDLQSGLTTYELTLTFTIFVFLQFWNLFNAKAFHTGATAFRGLFTSFGGFHISLIIILVGQFLIVNFGGEMFSVEPLKWYDWLACFIGTSPVLIFGEIIRLFITDK